MSYSEMLTPQMIEVLLPTLGFSILLNVLLLVALLVKSFHHLLLAHLRTYWIGVQLALHTNRRSTQRS